MARRSPRGRPCGAGERTPSAYRQLEADGFLVISHEQVAAGEGGVVPGFVRQGRNPRQLDELYRVGPDQHDIAVFRLDDEQVAGQQELPMLVSPSLPDLFAFGDVEAR